jgi:hypothetical protein
VDIVDIAQPAREALPHGLYEAAELERNLRCACLQQAFRPEGAQAKSGFRSGTA